jgi:hypothetical protein
MSSGPELERMYENSQYDKYPVVRVAHSSELCRGGWQAIAAELASAVRPGKFVLCVECYPGAFEGEIERELTRASRPSLVVLAKDSYLREQELLQLTARDLGDDPVFGFMGNYALRDFFSTERLHAAQASVQGAQGLVIVVGTGASLIAQSWDALVYCDMARWEIQQRQRSGEIANLGLTNFEDRPSLKYKRAFFVDWRAADRQKKLLLDRIDYLLDTNDRNQPVMIPGSEFRRGLDIAASQPFRLVPFFDPGPWGGQWMKKVCKLPQDVTNFAWCFDCVPEENSLLLGFGSTNIQIPSIDLVFQHPRGLLGDAVHARFGTEFPIRFDFLDTMEGGNLSFQVHPLTEYIQEHFGMHYTQDESYYLLDAGDGGCVYLGLKEGIDRDRMIADLRAAQEGGAQFETDKYANRWAAKKHDHFLIPAGTPHCSGKNCLVLEISATPYIFTFKMWDWGRLGLDGRPRPIHIDHGIRNIQWDRTTSWVKRNLVNSVEQIDSGDGWFEERTGLHLREFIETRRHWFDAPVLHATDGGVQVLNLCEGEEAIVESPENAFPPLVVHYAETFIVPAAVGSYCIRPHGPSKGKKCGTIMAFVRTRV